MVFVGRRRKTVRALVPGQGAWDGGGGGGITDRNPQREKEGARERRGGRAGGSEEVGGGGSALLPILPAPLHFLHLHRRLAFILETQQLGSNRGPRAVCF